MNIVQEDALAASEIVTQLQKGKTMVYPTETCYGIGCDARNQAAVEKIFTIKKRDPSKPVLVIAHDPSVMMNYVEWDETLDEIAEKYWPGPLTIVARTKKDCGLARGVIAEDNTIAFRITSHSLASSIAEELGGPIVSTSANIAGMEAPYDVARVQEMFGNEEHQPDIVIDGGELPNKSPSTIVKITDGSITIIRQGEIII